MHGRFHFRRDRHGGRRRAGQGTPAAAEDYIGADSFRYKASDGSQQSAAQTIRLTVRSACGGVAATKVGTSVADTLTGTAGADVIVNLGGADRIRGLAGNNRVCGGSGADMISAGAGRRRADRRLGH
jgi:Ca2+-binding RTX toxin-like protein